MCTPNTALVALTTPRSHRAELFLAHMNSRGRRNPLLLKLRNVLSILKPRVSASLKLLRFLTLRAGDSPRRVTTWFPAALMRTTCPHRVRG